MTRVWWRLVFLLSLFNIVLFLFHFIVLLMSSRDSDEERHENPDEKQGQKQSAVKLSQVLNEADYVRSFPALCSGTGFYDSEKHKVNIVRLTRSWARRNLSKDKFTITILTHGRTDVLLTLLQRYVKAVADGKLPQLSKILVVWNNIHTAPPTKKWRSLAGPQAFLVIFLRQKENRLTNRFHVFDEIETEAIFTQDDDIYASPLDLKFAFNVFKKFPDKLVGFYARMHAQRSRDGLYLYSSNPRHNTYSMILTGACFIHINYLKLFEEQQPVIRDTIDSLMNGEDIAMNMMISNYTKEPAGFYVKPVFLGTIKSVLDSRETLHNGNDHIMKRSRCLNEMTRFYGMPLVSSDITFQQYLYTWKKQNHVGETKKVSPTPSKKRMKEDRNI